MSLEEILADEIIPLVDIDGMLDQSCSKDANLQHMRNFTAGYRSQILGNQETRGGSPGGARDVSFQMGREMALRDLNHFETRTFPYRDPAEVST
jgi:hypothetical protein